MHVDEDFADPAVVIFAGAQIDFVAADHRFLRITLAPVRHALALADHGDALDHLLDHAFGEVRRARGCRLLDERVEACVLWKRALVECGAHHDDRCLAARARTALEELEAVDLGHGQIEHHDIGTELAASIEAFGSVARGDDDVAGLRECRHDHFASRTVVLDDEDLLQFRHRQAIVSSAAPR